MIRLRVSEREYQMVHAHARAYGVTVSDYLRLYPGNRDKCEFLKQEIMKLQFEIHKIGVNINQIAKDNNAGFYSSTDIDTLQKGLRTINEKMDEVLFEIRGS